MKRQTKFLALLCTVFAFLFLGCSHIQDNAQVDPLRSLEIFDELHRPIELTRDADPLFRAAILEELSLNANIPPETRQIILDELRRAREELKSREKASEKEAPSPSF